MIIVYSLYCTAVHGMVELKIKYFGYILLCNIFLHKFRSKSIKKKKKKLKLLKITIEIIIISIVFFQHIKMKVRINIHV
jgi:hypothetical protein